MKLFRHFGFLCIGVGIALYGSERDVECRIGASPHSSCDPYDVRLLKLDKVRYERERTSLEQLREKRKLQPISPLFSVKEWLERYVTFEPSLRFRGTAEVFNKAIDTIKERVEKVSEKLEKSG